MEFKAHTEKMSTVMFRNADLRFSLSVLRFQMHALRVSDFVSQMSRFRPPAPIVILQDPGATYQKHIISDFEDSNT